MSKVIFWFRSDLRLSDNPALLAACENAQTVIPVYILDDESAGTWKRGGAARWWLHQSLSSLSQSLAAHGFGPLILRRGKAGDVINQLLDETGAADVYWNRCYEPWAMQRDTAIKQSLKSRGVGAHSFGSYLLFEPWEIKNKTGGDYKVYTPFSKACFEMPVRPPASLPPKRKTSPFKVKSLALEDLALMPRINWYEGMAAAWQPGEQGAQKRLAAFVDKAIGQYKATRDFPADEDGISRLSPHLHFGEISPHQCWHAAKDKNNAFGWLRQLVWREFSYHLLYHAPALPDKEWNDKFRHFPWQKNDGLLKRWQRGQTGFPIVDAGMRELWQTGWMHNRVRMIVGSFLVKNLLLDWREGEKWFWDTLVDADLGNNAAGWQWIAGCGADAAPYFRIFNPLLQSKKFDPRDKYIRRYLPELRDVPDLYIHTPWEAPVPPASYPAPVVDLSTSRDRALEAYAICKSAA